MIISILQDNKFAQLLEVDEEVLPKIRKHLSYKQQGVEYTPAFKRGWDGITYLIDKRNVFPIGLVSYLTGFLDDKKISYTIEDLRCKKSSLNPIDLNSRLAELKKIPRYYQEEAVKAAVAAERGIIKAATGSGKTLIACLIAAALGKKTVIHVIGTDLLYQFHKEFTNIFQREIGIIGNGECDIKDITIASVWTTGKALKMKSKDIVQEDVEEEKFDERNTFKIIQCMKEAKVHIFDECHIATCNTIKNIYDLISPEHIYGMSGTPLRLDGADLLITGILGDNLVDIKASQMIKEGVLAQPFIKFINVPSTPLDGHTYPEIYSEFIINNSMRNQLVLSQVKYLISKGYQVLVLFNAIKHGDILSKLFEEDGGIKFELLDGSDDSDRREHVKELALSKKIDCIIASKIFDIGVDIPSLSGLVLAGGGKSYVKAMQKIGRVIRGYPGKKHAAIVDFIDNAKYLKNHSKRRYEIYKLEPYFKVMGYVK